MTILLTIAVTLILAGVSYPVLFMDDPIGEKPGYHSFILFVLGVILLVSLGLVALGIHIATTNATAWIAP